MKLRHVTLLAAVVALAGAPLGWAQDDPGAAPAAPGKTSTEVSSTLVKRLENRLSGGGALLHLSTAQTAEYNQLLHGLLEDLDRGVEHPGARIGAFARDVEQLLPPRDRDSIRGLHERLFRTTSNLISIPERLRLLGAVLDLDGAAGKKFERGVEQVEAEIASAQPDFDELRQLLLRMQMAKEAGDNQQVQMIRQQIAEQPGAGDEAAQDLLAELSEQLKDERQQQIIEDFNRLGMPNSGDVRGTGLPILFRAAQSCNLSADQSRKLRSLRRDATRDMRRARRDEAKQQQVVDSTRHEIEQLLDDEQKTQFTEALENPGSRRSRPTRTLLPGARGRMGGGGGGNEGDGD